MIGIMMNSVKCFVFIILVVDLSILVECQQKLNFGNKRSFFSGTWQNQVPQYQNKPQYQQGYQNQWPQGYNSQSQWPQGYNSQSQWPQGYNSQSQWPQGQQFPNQWGNQLPQIPQLSQNFPNFHRPSIGQVLDTTLDIIKKTQQALQFIPRKN